VPGLLSRPPSQLSPPSSEASADYRLLGERIRAAGLLRRRPWYYGAKITMTITGFFLAWVAFVVVGNSWAVLGVAALLSVMFTQVVFLGHDAGHRQIAGSQWVNRLVGLAAGNALTGLSFGWWVPKHNAHHAYPNQVDRDPDLGNGLIGFTTPNGLEASSGSTAPLRVRLERWLFVVVLLFQGLGLHVTSVQSIVRRRRLRLAVVEGILLVGNATVYLFTVLWVLSPAKAVAFIAVQQGLFGLYLGFSFAPNHKGMPIVGRDEQLPFVERQVTTARNVTGGWLITTTLGGLNYQIEHHLFPAMPRPNLARAQRIVQAFCAEQGLAYRQEGVIASYRKALLPRPEPTLDVTGLRP
jgi:fatty acid desaturase